MAALCFLYSLLRGFSMALSWFTFINHCGTVPKETLQQHTPVSPFLSFTRILAYRLLPHMLYIIQCIVIIFALSVSNCLYRLKKMKKIHDPHVYFSSIILIPSDVGFCVISFFLRNYIMNFATSSAHGNGHPSCD